MVKNSVLKYSIGYADGYKRDKYYCTLVTRMDINVTNIIALWLRGWI